MKVYDEVLMENGLVMGFVDPMETLYPDWYLRPTNPVWLKAFEEKLKVAEQLLPPNLQPPFGMDEATFRTIALMYAVAALTDWENRLPKAIQDEQQRQKMADYFPSSPNKLVFRITPEDIYGFIQELYDEMYRLKAEMSQFRQQQPQQPPPSPPVGNVGVANQLGLPPIQTGHIADYGGAVRRHKVGDG